MRRGLFLGVQFPALELFLTCNAILRPRHRFEPLMIDGGAAIGALAKGALTDAAERHFRQVQETALLRTLVEEKLLGGVGDGAVERIPLDAAIERAALLLGALDAVAQFVSAA